jgi:hypothetical protein
VRADQVERLGLACRQRRTRVLPAFRAQDLTGQIA